MTVYDERRAQHHAMILAELENGTEKSAKEIARHLPLSLYRVDRCLKSLLAENGIHVSRTFSATKFYRAGTGPAQAPIEQRLLAVLDTGPKTADELAQALGLGAVHVRGIIVERLSSGDARQVYIAKYLRSGKQRIHVYARGNLPDAKRPRPLTDAQKQARYRARRAKDAEKAIETRAKSVAKYMKPRQDAFMGQFAGLFGQRMAA